MPFAAVGTLEPVDTLFHAHTAESNRIDAPIDSCVHACIHAGQPTGLTPKPRPIQPSPRRIPQTKRAVRIARPVFHFLSSLAPPLVTDHGYGASTTSPPLMLKSFLNVSNVMDLGICLTDPSINPNGTMSRCL